MKKLIAILGLLLLASLPAGAQTTWAFGNVTSNGAATGPTPGTVQFRMNTCNTGWTEQTSMADKTILVTTVAAGDAGTTGGSNAITPTISSLTAAAQTFTGSALATHSHTGGTFSAAAQVLSWPVGVPTNASGAYASGALSWPAGVPTNASGAFAQGALSWPAGVPAVVMNSFSSIINHTHPATLTVQGGTTAAVTGTHVMTSTATGGSARLVTSGDAVATANPVGGVASITPTTSSVTWPAGVPTIAAGVFTQPTISWPAGVPTIAAGSFTQPTISWPGGVPTAASSSVSGTSQAVSAGTPSGTNGPSAVTGTLNQFDNRSAWVKLIMCVKD
jgi:hypothetical protein